MRNKIFLFLSVVTMIIIFFFSSQEKSETYHISGAVTKSVNNVTKKITSGIYVNSNETTKVTFYDKYLKKYLTEYYIRKIAHVFLYTILSICLLGFFLKDKYLNSVLLTLITSVIYAASDEFHQSFTDGRFSNIKDVFIDLCGIVLGIILFLIIYSFFTKTPTYQKKETIV